MGRDSIAGTYETTASPRSPRSPVARVRSVGVSSRHGRRQRENPLAAAEGFLANETDARSGTFQFGNRKVFATEELHRCARVRKSGLARRVH